MSLNGKKNVLADSDQEKSEDLLVEDSPVRGKDEDEGSGDESEDGDDWDSSDDEDEDEEAELIEEEDKRNEGRIFETVDLFGEDLGDHDSYDSETKKTVSSLMDECLAMVLSLPDENAFQEHDDELSDDQQRLYSQLFSALKNLCAFSPLPSSRSWNELTQEGRSLLHQIIKAKKVVLMGRLIVEARLDQDIAKLLIKQLTTRDSSGETPFLSAVHHNDLMALQQIIHLVSNTLGLTAVEAVVSQRCGTVSKKSPYNGFSCAFLSVVTTSNAVSRALLQPPADPKDWRSFVPLIEKTPFDRKTLLHETAFSGQAELLRLLLQRRSLVYLVDERDRSGFVFFFFSNQGSDHLMIVFLGAD